jgi:hypothetical protein
MNDCKLWREIVRLFTKKKKGNRKDILFLGTEEIIADSTRNNSRLYYQMEKKEEN